MLTIADFLSTDPATGRAFLPRPEKWYEMGYERTFGPKAQP